MDLCSFDQPIYLSMNMNLILPKAISIASPSTALRATEARTWGTDITFVKNRSYEEEVARLGAEAERAGEDND